MLALILTLYGLVLTPPTPPSAPSLESLAQAEEKDEVEVTKADAGKEVKLKVGQTLVLQLPMHAGSGYQWKVSECKRPALKEKGKARLNPNNLPVEPGGEEPWVQKFEVNQTARFDLVLKEVRVFDPDAKPRNTFKVKIVIEGSAGTIAH